MLRHATRPCPVCWPAGYAIDITLPALRIAVEADGPSHASRLPGGGALGATAMKRRHLQLLGWHVISVTYKVTSPGKQLVQQLSSCVGWAPQL
jgi:hypothetical protein